MNYEGMSNLEIAVRVLVVKGIPHKIEHGSCFINHGYEDGACTFTLFDPCNNWADAGPIMLENGIGISKYDLDKDNPLHGFWFSDQYNLDYDSWVDDKNPLRAAMICFLKMKDAENE